MPNVAIVTDSASDLPLPIAEAMGIRVVPLLVRFGTHEYRSGVDLSTADFWARMLAPDAPFPTTAAAAPGAFAEAFSDSFAAGAESVVCVTVGSRLSGTFASAEVGAQQHPDREIHVVDSTSASMGTGHLAMHAAELAAAGRTGVAIAATIRERAADLDLYVALDTLEYLRKGGRLSAARAAIGTML
ncbi:MAG TPA: DegV family protein, partial [Candidatus Limnocylindrales bacterium]